MRRPVIIPFDRVSGSPKNGSHFLSQADSKHSKAFRHLARETAIDAVRARGSDGHQNMLSQLNYSHMLKNR